MTNKEIAKSLVGEVLIAEFARILRELADTVATGYGQYNLARLQHDQLFDAKGERVGVVHVRKTFAGRNDPLDYTSGLIPVDEGRTE